MRHGGKARWSLGEGDQEHERLSSGPAVQPIPGTGGGLLPAALAAAAALVALLAAIVLAAHGTAARAALAVAVVLLLAALALGGLHLRKRSDNRTAYQPCEKTYEHPPMNPGRLGQISCQVVESEGVHRSLPQLTIDRAITHSCCELFRTNAPVRRTGFHAKLRARGLCGRGVFGRHGPHEGR